MLKAEESASINRVHVSTWNGTLQSLVLGLHNAKDDGVWDPTNDGLWNITRYV